MPVEELRALLRYEPETGHLYWKVSTHGRRMSQPAGHPHPKTGYVSLMINGERWQAHGLIWFLVTGDWLLVDHRDLNGSNNVWENLRPATNSQNGVNRKAWAKSGFKGVYPTASGKWTARIKVDGKIINFPSRVTAEEAWHDYCAAARRHFGEFARFD